MILVISMSVVHHSISESIVIGDRCETARIEVVSELMDTAAGKDAEEALLVLVEVGGGLAAVAGELGIGAEDVDTGEGEMGEFGAAVKELVDALGMLAGYLGPLRLENLHPR